MATPAVASAAIDQSFPAQVEWSEAEYLSLQTNKLVEYKDGRIEVLPVTTLKHQRIALLLYRLLFAYIEERDGGEVLVAPLRVYLRPRLYREPDVIFLSTERAAATDRYPHGADLVMEVVSPDNPEHDYERKRQEYAEAGIPEYWIVDPQREAITVLSLAGRRYAAHGEFALDERATSVLLNGFAVEVSDVFAAGERH